MVEPLQLTGQNNDLFGSDVIVPPASSLEEAKNNPAKYEHKDWYLCTEKMPK